MLECREASAKEQLITVYELRWVGGYKIQIPNVPNDQMRLKGPDVNDPHVTRRAGDQVTRCMRCSRWPSIPRDPQQMGLKHCIDDLGWILVS